VTTPPLGGDILFVKGITREEKGGKIMKTALILILIAVIAAAVCLGNAGRPCSSGTAIAPAPPGANAPGPVSTPANTAKGISKGNVFIGAGLDKPIVSSLGGDDVVLKVGLFCQTLPRASQRPPVSVAVVLDKSGSMGSGGKMENARRGAIEVVKRLTAEDTFSLIVYDSTARVLIPAQSAADRDALIEAISSINACGSTALYDGVRLGAEELRKDRSDNRDRRIILLSDGLANVGPSSTSAVAGLGKSLAGEGIVITTVGVGLDYNEDLMTTLADVSRGNAYFAKGSGDLTEIFVREIGDTLNVAAKDVHIAVTCKNGAAPLDFLGRSGSIAGPNAEVTVGSLYKDKEKFALLRIRVPGGGSGEKKEVAEVAVTFTDPFTGKIVKALQNVAVEFNADRNMAEKAQDRRVQKDLTLTQAYMSRNQAIKLADEGKHEEAAKILGKNALQLEAFSTLCGNDKDLAEEARRCRRHSETLQANKMMDSYQRKRMMNESFAGNNQQSYESR
jgi:Ca-activated chloride channel family protein